MSAPGRLLAGVDIGGTKILGIVLDPADPGTVVAETKVPTPPGEDAVFDAIAGVVRDLGEEAGAAVGAVGVGIAGLVDLDGILRVGPNLPGLRGVRVGDELDRRLDLPIRVDNDATCAAWGEHLAGAARGVPDVVCVTLGTGIGAGIIADNELVRGAHGFGGEAGHMIVDPRGPQCPCGRRGCWERFASGSGLARLGREAAEAGLFPRGVAMESGVAEHVRGEDVTRAAAQGDPDALAVMESFGDWVAIGVGNIVTLLDCSLVVIGGGLVEAGDLLMDPVRRAYERRVMIPDERKDVRIVAAELGERAGAIGAALLGGRDAPAERGAGSGQPPSLA
ncbi:MAG TPA: ROK family protein [Acidimicrobiales bacterium]|nr:ROK family protein [Acidimicrobiales bacterium]